MNNCDWPAAVTRRFRLIAFDWDGTAVLNRRVDASPVRSRLQGLLERGVWIVIVTGTNVDTIHRQCSAAMSPDPRRRLVICANRGSEVFGFEADLPVPRYRRLASPDEDASLTAAAEEVCSTLRAITGLTVQLVADRMNRRKIDLIPEPAWEDPPKSEIGALREATDRRLRDAGLTGGLAEAVDLAWASAERHGLHDASVTSDAKHIEIGLTDKADSMRWVEREVMRPFGIRPAEALIGGDEFGPVGAASGSDARMLIPELAGAVAVSVGPEPFGVPLGVVHLPGGPARFVALLEYQLKIWEQAGVRAHV